MARNYAQIMTAIWRNAEFRALGEAEQRGYLLLVTQPDISACGVLPLRLRRWADMAADSTTQGMTQVLKALESGRFVVVDWDVEEVLVRSFIRWDGGFNNPKRRPVIIRTAAESDSELIRRHLAAEFQRCGLPGGPPDSPPPTSGSPADSQADSLSGAAPKINKADRRADPFPQVNSLSDSHAASDGVVGTYLSTGGATTHNPETPPPAVARAHARPDPERALIDEWITTRRKRPPRNVIQQTARWVRSMLSEGIDPDDIRAGIQVWAEKGLSPAVLPSVVNEVMNRPAAPTLRAVNGGAPQQGTSTQRANAFLALRKGGNQR